MTVSVIICTYNRPSFLRLSLLSFARQDRIPDEIVVADDGSGPETADAVRLAARDLPCPLRHAWQEDLGFRLAASRNTAFRASSGEYLIFTTDDLVAARGFIGAHVTRARPDTFLLGNAVRLDPVCSASLLAGELDIPSVEAMPHSQERQHLMRVHRQNLWHAFLRRLRLCKQHKPKLVGYNFSLHRADYEKVNGSDEDFVGWGAEDDDLGRRLMLVGVRPRSIVPYAVGYHIYHPTSGPERWMAAPNAGRLDRRKVEAFCRNGLVKRTLPER